MRDGIQRNTKGLPTEAALKMAHSKRHLPAMSSKDDEYRRHADDALRMTNRAISDLDRAAWLRVAEGWLGLIKLPERTAEQVFDDDVRDRRTGLSSDESN